MNKEELEELLNREELTLASISKRASAFMLDELLLSILLVVGFWNSFANAKDSLEVVALSQQLTYYYIVLKVVYQAFFVAMYGATLGKMLLRIKVIHISNLDKPFFAASLNRAVFRILSEMIFYLGFVWGMMDPLKRTWHDLTARTLVIES